MARKRKDYIAEEKVAALGRPACASTAKWCRSLILCPSASATLWLRSTTEPSRKTASHSAATSGMSN